eukprot:3733802-Rhodomonas_salina.1
MPTSACCVELRVSVAAFLCIAPAVLPFGMLPVAFDTLRRQLPRMRSAPALCAECAFRLVLGLLFSHSAMLGPVMW